MYLKTVFIGVILLSFSRFARMNDCNAYCPFDNNCGSCGFTPVNIISNQTQSINLPTLTFINGINETGYVENNGVAIAVIFNSTKKIFAYGGPLCYNETYILYADLYFWTTDGGDRCAHTIDDEGSLLEIQSLFYNEKYGNIFNALNFFDGPFIDVTTVKVDNEPDNPGFNYFLNALELVKTPGSKVYVEGGQYAEFFATPNQSADALYYTYKGQFNSQVLGDKNSCSYCTTIAITDFNDPSNGIPRISRSQFKKGFGGLQDVTKKQLLHSVPIYSQNGQKIFSARGMDSINVYD